MNTYCAVHGEDENHQEEREVSRAVVLYEHKDEAADEHDWDGVDEEPEAVAGSVAGEGVEEGPDHHEDVWWSCEQEVDHVVVVVKCRFGEGREEVLETRKWC